MRALAFAVVLGFAGCWLDVPPPIAPSAPPPRHAPRVVDFRPHVTRTVWIGHYVCPQGLTALELTVEVRGDNVAAVFEFGPADSNPNIPHGSYRMTGTVRDDGRELAYELAPDEWLERPPGYEMVGLNARTIERQRLRGRIRHAGCGMLDAELRP